MKVKTADYIPSDYYSLVELAGLNTGSGDYVNIALRQPTWQSSTFNAAWTSDKAVDGNKDTKILDQHCSHTAGVEVHPWLAVDLGSPVFIYGINLTNRGDCCGECTRLSYIVYVFCCNN